MYVPRHFDQQDASDVTALVKSHPLAALVTRAGSELVANHVPFMLDGELAVGATLLGHVAKSNEVWQQTDPAADVLLIFQGPSAYITPNWYPSKQEHHQVVPTYNYVVAHVYGRLVASHDEQVKRKIVEQLTATMEQGRASPWKVSDAPADFITTLLGAIFALELSVTRIQAKWKVSQNRSTVDRDGVAAGLAQDGPSDFEQKMSQIVRSGRVA